MSTSITSGKFSLHANKDAVSYRLALSHNSVGVIRYGGISNYTGSTTVTASVSSTGGQNKVIAYSELEGLGLALRYSVDGGSGTNAMGSYTLNVLETGARNTVTFMLIRKSDSALLDSADFNMNDQNVAANPNMLRGCRLDDHARDYWTTHSNACATYVSEQGKDSFAMAAKFNTYGYNETSGGQNNPINVFGQQVGHIVKDKTYTFSFWARRTLREGLPAGEHKVLNFGAYQMKVDNSGWETSWWPGNLPVYDDSEYHLYKLSFKARNSCDVGVNIYIHGEQDVWITQPKLEEGSYVTSWLDNELDRQGANGCQSRVWQNELVSGQEYRNDSNYRGDLNAYYNDFIMVLCPEVMNGGKPADGYPGGYMCFRCKRTHTYTGDTKHLPSMFSSSDKIEGYMKSLRDSAGNELWEVMSDGGTQFFTTIIAQSANIRMLSGSSFVINNNANQIVAGMGDMMQGDTPYNIWAGGYNASSSPFVVYKNGVVKANLVLTPSILTWESTSSNRDGYGRYHLDPLVDKTTTCFVGDYVLPKASDCIGLSYRFIMPVEFANGYELYPFDGDYIYDGAGCSSLDLSKFVYVELVSVGSGWAIVSANLVRFLQTYVGRPQKAPDFDPSGFVTVLNPGIANRA